MLFYFSIPVLNSTDCRASQIILVAAIFPCELRRHTLSCYAASLEAPAPSCARHRASHFSGHWLRNSGTFAAPNMSTIYYQQIQESGLSLLLWWFWIQVKLQGDFGANLDHFFLLTFSW